MKHMENKFEYVNTIALTFPPFHNINSPRDNTIAHCTLFNRNADSTEPILLQDAAPRLYFLKNE